MNKSFIIIPFLLIAMLFPIKTLAWGNKGHAFVAEVAFKYLDRKTKKTVLQYLDGMTIEEAANWMDNIKKDHSYDYMKPYHYANFDKGTNVIEVNGDNIVYQLNKTIAELRNKQKLSKEEIKTKIEILLHLVGDLHQPLHVGYGSDKGGNSAQINYRDKGTNLHSFWDYGIIESKNITLKDCLKSNKFCKKEIRNIQQINVVLWSVESRGLLDQIYNTGGNKVSDEYVNTNAVLIENQILKAGIRLAAVLKEVFKS